MFEIQWHRRIALGCAPIIFALLGIPLGLRRSRGARSWGLLLCAVVVFGYYSLLSFSQEIARAQWVPVPVALWLPNGLIAAAAAVLLLRERRGPRA